MPEKSLWIALALCGALTACGPADDSPEAHEERMAEQHKDDTAEPSPAAKVAPSAPIEASEVVYANVDGHDVTGYLARPEEAEGDLPAVIVIHEWWGLNDNIRSMADQLAGEGYLALAVDLYGGESATERDGALALSRAARQNSEATQENLRLAHAYLKDEQGATRIGTIGWCFGGGLSLQAGLMLGSEVHATVIYYGRVIAEREQLAALEAPLLGIFGALDEGIPIDGVREFEAVLGELGKNASIHVYEGADHAFANPSGTRYNAEAATDAWHKTLAFLEEHLKT